MKNPDKVARGTAYTEEAQTLTAISTERAENHGAVFTLLCSAFGREHEARLVQALRAAPGFDPELSLVAHHDGLITGYILFSPVTIETAASEFPALALAPLAVVPDLQGTGIGTLLVRHGLTRCRDQGHGIVIVLGDPAYYSRFGFSPAAQNNIRSPFPAPDEAFMVRELFPGALSGIAGMVRYPAPFDRV
jgi:putative acetyltransferase